MVIGIGTLTAILENMSCKYCYSYSEVDVGNDRNQFRLPKNIERDKKKTGFIIIDVTQN